MDTFKYIRKNNPKAKAFLIVKSCSIATRYESDRTPIKLEFVNEDPPSGPGHCKLNVELLKRIVKSY